MEDAKSDCEESSATMEVVGRWCKRLLNVATLVAVGFLLLTMLLIGPAYLEAVIHLLFGFFIFLARVLPKVRPAPIMIVQGVLLWGLAAVLLRSFWNWLATNRGGKALGWGQSIQLVSGVVLLFVAGTAFTGLIHHARWVYSDEAYFSAGGMTRRVNCAGNLKQLGLYLIIYAADNQDWLPPNDDFAVIEREHYLKLDGVARCPRAKRTEAASDYLYRGGGLQALGDQVTTTIIMHDRVGNHGDGWVNLCFLDGHVKGERLLPGEGLADMAKRLGLILPEAYGPVPRQVAAGVAVEDSQIELPALEALDP